MSEYNGWTNYETWLVNLWLDNDPHTSGEVVRIANSTGEYHACRDLEEFIHELCDTDNLSGLVCDLVRSALSEVNWREIVKHYRDEDSTDNDEGNDDE